MSNSVDYQYRQVSCQRSVKGPNFANGICDFNWSTGRPYGFIPARSYFRIALSLRGRGGLSRPNTSEGLALADSPCGNLFNTVYLRAGGQDVSSIVNYVPQAQQVKNRLDKSGSWLHSIGRDSFGSDADFGSRVTNVWY